MANVTFRFRTRNVKTGVPALGEVTVPEGTQPEDVVKAVEAQTPDVTVEHMLRPVPAKRG